MSELKSKKVEVVKFLTIIIGIIIVMGIVATIITATQPKINYMSSSPTATMNNKSLSNSSVLSSGVYVAGQDFKGGKYNIIAVSGSGNISSSNMYTGGVDGEISSDNNEYRNINLPNGTKLTISGDVSVKLVENS